LWVGRPERVVLLPGAFPFRPFVEDIYRGDLTTGVAASGRRSATSARELSQTAWLPIFSFAVSRSGTTSPLAGSTLEHLGPDDAVAAL
jgi:hypothetical protein